VLCLGPRLVAVGVFVMERSFTVEAKSFHLSAKSGCPNLRLEERRKGFVGYIYASVQCSEWLVETVESAIQAQVKEEIAKTFREGDKAMMVHGGGNKAGRFLEVSFLVVGGRKGVIWLPEGRFGNGWRRFAGELRRLLEAQRLATGSEGVGDSSAKVVSGSYAPGVDRKRSYVQALCATPVVEERAASLRNLDLFPVLSQFESRTIGEDLRVAVDCAALEGVWPCSMEAAGSARASGLGAEVEGLKKLIGLLDLKLDRVITGLSLRPTRWRRKKFRVVGLDYDLVRKTRSVIDENLDLGLERCVGSGLDQEVLDPGLDLGFDLASVLKPVSCPWLPGDPSGCAATQELSTRVPELLTESTPILPELSPNSPERSPEFIHDFGSGSPETQMEIPPDLLGCSPVFTLNQGSGAEASTVKAVIEVVGDVSVQEEGYIGELQVHSSRSPELLTEKPPISPERSPELLLMDGSGVDDGIVVETFTGTVGDNSAQREGSNGEPPAVGLELSLVPLAVIPAEESNLTLTVVAPPDAGDGSFQRLGPGFSVPSAEEFLDFLPAGSLSKDWQDFFSSLHTDRRGMSESELIKEAFALPWEVDEPASLSCRDEEASSSGVEGGTQMVRPPAPMKSLLRRGFFGSRIGSPHPVVLKEVLPVFKNSDISTEDEASSISGPVILPSLLEDKQGVHSTQVCESSNRTVETEPNPINSSVSWYNRRVKGKMAKQLNKNKELIAEAVGILPVGGGDRVSDALNLAPVLGLSWGGEDKKLRDIIEATVPKVKGMRELKNLDCDISPVKDKRRRGWSGSKNARSFPPEVH
jgi:hypothetical protein